MQPHAGSTERVHERGLQRKLSLLSGLQAETVREERKKRQESSRDRESTPLTPTPTPTPSPTLTPILTLTLTRRARGTGTPRRSTMLRRRTAGATLSTGLPPTNQQARRRARRGSSRNRRGPTSRGGEPCPEQE